MMSRILSTQIIITFISMTCLPGYLYSVKLEKTLNHLLLGKIYWYYSQADWETATLVCARDGHSLVQLLTNDEQNWIQKNFKLLYEKFWVGGVEFQKHWYWKYPTWRIPVNKNRWFMRFHENQKVVAHEDHLHSETASSKHPFICEMNYFSRSDLFTKTTHMVANKLLLKQDGGEVECASRCLLTHDCQLILLQSDGTCKLYSVGRPYLNLDCTSTGKQCFYRKTITEY